MKAIVGDESKIGDFLTQVGAALHGLPQPEADDILRELRSHICDLAGEDRHNLDEALESLGDPVELANTYRATKHLEWAECSSSPLVILQGLRHASRARLGRITATALYAFGYINVFTLWSGAADKLLSPARGGIWYVPGDWSSITLITNANPPDGAHELLGWWLVPLAALAGYGVKVVTDRTARWWIGRHRHHMDSEEV